MGLVATIANFPGRPREWKRSASLSEIVSGAVGDRGSFAIWPCLLIKFSAIAAHNSGLNRKSKAGRGFRAHSEEKEILVRRAP